MRCTALLVLALAACGSHHGGGGGGDDTQTFDSLAIEPPEATLTVALGGTATQAYQVFGVTGDDRTDITARCSLQLDPGFGTASGAVVTVAPHGGKTNVTAVCGDAGQVAAQLVVNLRGTVVLGTNTPGDAATTFGGAVLGTDAGRAPGIEYPLDGAVSPRNIPPIETQWSAGGNDLFHVALASDFLAIDAYTTDLQATFAAGDWEAIASTAAGGHLQIVVEGLQQAAAQTKYASPSATLTMSTDIIDNTAIYYWASSQGSIMSETFGDVGAPTVVKDDCTACHSVSRSGQRIGYSRCVGGDCGAQYVGFMRFDQMQGSFVETFDANNRVLRGSYTTFAPVGNPYATDDQALAMVTNSAGQLELRDPDTGAAVASNLTEVAAHGPGAPRAALMADWSADGTRVVYASSPHPGQYVDLTDGRIAVMSYTYAAGAHQFGEPTMLVPDPITLPSGVYNNFFFPSFSADGALVVFNAARDVWRNFTDARTSGQRLMLADANGAWVTDLPALNGPADADITWAHWAPAASNDYYWLVFSSERDYGHEVTLANTAPSCVANGVKQCKQIWIGAIAKSKVSGGTVAIDPSAPPMWLPGQDPRTDNISPYWSVPTQLQ